MLQTRLPAANAFARMATALDGVESVRRIELSDQPTVFLFEVQRGSHGSVFVAWEKRDSFTGDDEPALTCSFSWNEPGAKAVEVLDFKDATAGQKGPIAWQMHNKGLLDEYKDVSIEVDPRDDSLITTK